MSRVNPESYSQAPSPKEKDKEQTKSFFKVLQSIVLCQITAALIGCHCSSRWQKRVREREFTQSLTLIQCQISAKMLSNRKQFYLLLHNSELLFSSNSQISFAFVLAAPSIELLFFMGFLLRLFLLILLLNTCLFSSNSQISSPFVLADPSIELLYVFLEFTDFFSFCSC